MLRRQQNAFFMHTCARTCIRLFNEQECFTSFILTSLFFFSLSSCYICISKLIYDTKGILNYSFVVNTVKTKSISTVIMQL